MLSRPLAENCFLSKVVGSEGAPKGVRAPSASPPGVNCWRAPEGAPLESSLQGGGDAVPRNTAVQVVLASKLPEYVPPSELDEPSALADRDSFGAAAFGAKRRGCDAEAPTVP